MPHRIPVLADSDSEADDVAQQQLAVPESGGTGAGSGTGTKARKASAASKRVALREVINRGRPQFAGDDDDDDEVMETEDELERIGRRLSSSYQKSKAKQASKSSKSRAAGDSSDSGRDLDDFVENDLPGALDADFETGEPVFEDEAASASDESPVKTKAKAKKNASKGRRHSVRSKLSAIDDESPYESSGEANEKADALELSSDDDIRVAGPSKARRVIELSSGSSDDDEIEIVSAPKKKPAKKQRKPAPAQRKSGASEPAAGRQTPATTAQAKGRKTSVGGAAGSNELESGPADQPEAPKTKGRQSGASKTTTAQAQGRKTSVGGAAGSNEVESGPAGQAQGSKANDRKGKEKSKPSAASLRPVGQRALADFFAATPGSTSKSIARKGAQQRDGQVDQDGDATMRGVPTSDDDEVAPAPVARGEMATLATDDDSDGLSSGADAAAARIELYGGGAANERSPGPRRSVPARRPAVVAASTAVAAAPANAPAAATASAAAPAAVSSVQPSSSDDEVKRARRAEIRAGKRRARSPSLVVDDDNDDSPHSTKRARRRPTAAAVEDAEEERLDLDEVVIADHDDERPLEDDDDDDDDADTESELDDLYAPESSNAASSSEDERDEADPSDKVEVTEEDADGEEQEPNLMLDDDNDATENGSKPKASAKKKGQLAVKDARLIIKNIRELSTYGRGNPMFPFQWLLHKKNGAKLRYSKNQIIRTSELAYKCNNEVGPEYEMFTATKRAEAWEENVFWSNIAGTTQESKALKMLSKEVFGAKWSKFFVKRPGQYSRDPTHDRVRTGRLYYVRATSEVFPPAWDPFPARGDKDAAILVVDSARWLNGNRFQTDGAEQLSTRYERTNGLVKVATDVPSSRTSFFLVERTLQGRKLKRSLMEDVDCPDVVRNLNETADKDLFDAFDLKSGSELFESLVRRAKDDKPTFMLWNCLQVCPWGLAALGSLLDQVADEADLADETKMAIGDDDGWSRSHIGFGTSPICRDPLLASFNPGRNDDIIWIPFPHIVLFKRKLRKALGKSLPMRLASMSPKFAKAAAKVGLSPDEGGLLFDVAKALGELDERKGCPKTAFRSWVRYAGKQGAKTNPWPGELLGDPIEGA